MLRVLGAARSTQEHTNMSSIRCRFRACWTAHDRTFRRRLTYRGNACKQELCQGCICGILTHDCRMAPIAWQDAPELDHQVPCSCRSAKAWVDNVHGCQICGAAHRLASGPSLQQISISLTKCSSQCVQRLRTASHCDGCCERPDQSCRLKCADGTHAGNIRQDA